MRWLVLTGYMGAGKTSVGRRTAALLGCRFVDADEAIEAVAEMPVSEIFPKRGEVWFRRTEERVIRELLAEEPAGVLALGGGAVQSAKTRSLLGRRADVVWLRVDPEVAWRRVSGSDRPLATDRGRFVRRAAAREAGYAEVAGLEVAAEGPSDDLARRVAEWARSRAAEGER